VLTDARKKRNGGGESILPNFPTKKADAMEKRVQDLCVTKPIVTNASIRQDQNASLHWSQPDGRRHIPEIRRYQKDMIEMDYGENHTGI